jgi:hypothetical protein
MDTSSPPNNEAPATGKSRVSSKTNLNNGADIVADVSQEHKRKSGLSAKKKLKSAPTVFGLRLRSKKRLLVPCNCGDVHSYFYSERKALRFAHCAKPKRQRYYIAAADSEHQRKRVLRELSDWSGGSPLVLPTPLEQLTPEARAEEEQLREGGGR